MKYNGPKCRLCRSSGVKLFLKGEKCELPSCPVVRRQVAPGQRSKARLKISDFGLHLREKQKMKKMYLVSEAQLKKYYGKALKRLGNTGEILLSYLERKLDNVIVRAGIATSHSQARQFIKHKHFRVNGHLVDTPSAVLKVGDKVSFKTERQLYEVSVPSWLSLNAKKGEVVITGLPRREDTREDLNEQLIVEYYSR